MIVRKADRLGERGREVMRSERERKKKEGWGSLVLPGLEACTDIFLKIGPMP